MATIRHIQLARGTTEEWETSDSALWFGEIGIDTTLHRIKVGDGESLWDELPYYDDSDELRELLSELSRSLRVIDGGKAGTNEADYGSTDEPYDEDVTPVEDISGSTDEITTIEDD